MEQSQQRRRSSSGSQTPIEVLIRVRPSEVEEKTCLTFLQDGGLQCGQRMFWFDRVFTPDATQQQIYNQVGVKIIRNVLQGYNACVFAYGQTGSGKTYTMTGVQDRQFADNGLVQRCIHSLWSVLQTYQKVNFKVSFMEIYNQQIFDLFSVTNQKDTNQNMNSNFISQQAMFKIKQDPKEGMYVQNLSVQSVDSRDDILKLLEVGLKNRHKGETKMNRESSRSHSIFTIKISYEEANPLTQVRTVRNCKINFVDLAGSQKQKDTQAKGDRLKQATNINKSLTHLTTVIIQLSSNSQREKSSEKNADDSFKFSRSQAKVPYVSYRNSKLTYILKDSLGGNSKTTLIATVSSKSSMILQTLSTLTFAQRTKKVKQKAKVNAFIQGDQTALKENISRLQYEMQQLNEMLAKVNKQNENLKENLLELEKDKQQCRYCEQLCEYFNKLKGQYQKQIQNSGNYIRELQERQRKSRQVIEAYESNQSHCNYCEKEDQQGQFAKFMDMQQNQYDKNSRRNKMAQKQQSQPYYTVNNNCNEFSLYTINQDTEPSSFTRIIKTQNQATDKNEDQRIVRALRKQLEFKDIQMRQLKQELKLIKQSQDSLKQPIELLKNHLKKMRFDDFQKQFMKTLHTKMQFAKRELARREQIWNCKFKALSQQILILKGIPQPIYDKTQDEGSSQSSFEKPRGIQEVPYLTQSRASKQSHQTDIQSLNSRNLEGPVDNIFMERHLGRKTQGINQIRFFQSKNKLQCVIKKMQQEINSIQTKLKIEQLQNIKSKNESQAEIQRLVQQVKLRNETIEFYQRDIQAFSTSIRQKTQDNAELVKQISYMKAKHNSDLEKILKQAQQHQKMLKQLLQNQRKQAHRQACQRQNAFQISLQQAKVYQKHLQSKLKQVQQNYIILQKIKRYKQENQISLRTMLSKASDKQKHFQFVLKQAQQNQRSLKQKIEKLQMHAQIYVQQIQLLKQKLKSDYKKESKSMPNIQPDKNDAQDIMKVQNSVSVEVIGRRQNKLILRGRISEDKRAKFEQMDEQQIFCKKCCGQLSKNTELVARLQSQCANYQRKIQIMKLEISQATQEKQRIKEQLKNVSNKFGQIKGLLDS